jgi:hypothetical protein
LAEIQVERNPRLLSEGSGRWFELGQERWRWIDEAPELPMYSRYRPVRFPYRAPLASWASVLNVPCATDVPVHTQATHSSDAADDVQEIDALVDDDVTATATATDTATVGSGDSMRLFDSLLDASVDATHVPPPTLASLDATRSCSSSTLSQPPHRSASSMSAKNLATSTGSDSGVGISEGELTDDGLFEYYTPFVRPAVQVQLGSLPIRRRLFGANAIHIPIPPILILLLTEVLHPFYIFQIGSVTLWCFEQYYVYAIAIVAMSCIGALASVLQTRSNLFALRTLANYTCTITAYRNNEWSMCATCVQAVCKRCASSYQCTVIMCSTTVIGSTASWRFDADHREFTHAMRRPAARWPSRGQ